MKNSCLRCGTTNIDTHDRGLIQNQLQPFIYTTQCHATKWLSCVRKQQANKDITQSKWSKPKTMKKRKFQQKVK